MDNIIDNWLRMLLIMMCEDNDNITYKKLIPQDDGSCLEETKALNKNTLADLFCFLPDHRFHIFCICLEGMESFDQKKEYHFNILWAKIIKQRQDRYTAEKYMYSDRITFCRNIDEFVFNLFSDMVEFECINRNEFYEFSNFFKQTCGYDKEKFNSYYQGIKDVDIAFIFFISSDVYQTLMHRYNLPRQSSIVVKIPTIELNEKSNRYMAHEDDDKDKTRIINQMIKELSVEKQCEVLTFVENICESARPDELYKTSEPIEDKELKQNMIEKAERSD